MRKFRTKIHSGQRSPVYADGRARRIISAPNDTWIPQYREGENAPKWIDIGRATTKAIAMGIVGIANKGDQTR